MDVTMSYFIHSALAARYAHRRKSNKNKNCSEPTAAAAANTLKFIVFVFRSFV